MVGKTGVARLALTTQAPVIPIAQWGPQNLLGQYKKVLKPFPRKQVTVVAGPPVDLERPLRPPAGHRDPARGDRARHGGDHRARSRASAAGSAPAVPFDMRRAAARTGEPIAADDDAVVGPASPAPDEDLPTPEGDAPTGQGTA